MNPTLILGLLAVSCASNPLPEPVNFELLGTMQLTLFGTKGSEVVSPLKQQMRSKVRHENLREEEPHKFYHLYESRHKDDATIEEDSNHDQSNASPSGKTSKEGSDYTVLIVVLALTSVYDLSSLMFVVCSIVVWCICKARSNRESASSEVQMMPVSPPTDDFTLESTLFSKVQVAFTGPSCIICFVEYRSDSFLPDDLVNTPTCGHVFHVHCIKEWIKMHQVLCPL